MSRYSPLVCPALSRSQLEQAHSVNRVTDGGEEADKREDHEPP